MEQHTCPTCNGTRLKKESLWFKIDDKNIGELSKLDLTDLYKWFDGLDERMTARQQTIAKELLKEIRTRIAFILDVGLDYLALDRPSKSLSGGESQRINLTTSLGSSLVGSLYILDEPSIGLHSRDTDRLIKVLKDLQSLGNTVMVVEHDEEIMRASDYLIDVGPEGGNGGGTENRQDVVHRRSEQTADRHVASVADAGDDLGNNAHTVFKADAVLVLALVRVGERNCWRR